MSEVELNDKGHIIISVDGDQTAKSIADIVKRFVILANEVDRQKKMIKVLVDTSRLGKVDLSGRTAAIEGMKNITFDKVAFVIPEGQPRPLINMLVNMTGKNKKAQTFPTAELAEDWLS